MSSSVPASLSPLPRSFRLGAAAAALATVLASFGAMLVAFDSASPARWAQPTAELAQGIANCEHKSARASRVHCKQLLAQAALARTNRATELAQR